MATLMPWSCTSEMTWDRSSSALTMSTSLTALFLASAVRSRRISVSTPSRRPGAYLAEPELDARDVGQRLVFGGPAAVHRRLIPVAAQHRQASTVPGQLCEQLQQARIVPGNRVTMACPVDGECAIGSAHNRHPRTARSDPRDTVLPLTRDVTSASRPPWQIAQIADLRARSDPGRPPGHFACSGAGLAETPPHGRRRPATPAAGRLRSCVRPRRATQGDQGTGRGARPGDPQFRTARRLVRRPAPGAAGRQRGAAGRPGHAGHDGRPVLRRGRRADARRRSRSRPR